MCIRDSGAGSGRGLQEDRAESRRLSHDTVMPLESGASSKRNRCNKNSGVTSSKFVITGLPACAGNPVITNLDDVTPEFLLHRLRLLDAPLSRGMTVS